MFTENPAMLIVCDNKIKAPLVKACISKAPNLCLLLSKVAFRAAGKYDMELNEFKTNQLADQTFDNFCPFIMTKYTKKIKANKSTAK